MQAKTSNARYQLLTSRMVPSQRMASRIVILRLHCQRVCEMRVGVPRRRSVPRRIHRVSPHIGTMWILRQLAIVAELRIS